MIIKKIQRNLLLERRTYSYDLILTKIMKIYSKHIYFTSDKLK